MDKMLEMTLKAILVFFFKAVFVLLNNCSFQIFAVGKVLLNEDGNFS